jgi:arsenate reductase
MAVLGDQTRARLVGLIRDEPDGRALVGRLAEALGVTQPTVSHHMRALLDASIVTREPDGRRVWYSLAEANRDRVDAFLGSREADAAAPDLARISRDLAERFRGIFGPETVAQYVAESAELLASTGGGKHPSSRISAFAAARLDALARVDRHAVGTPEVLFVCVQNAGRSQLAAGILRHLAGDRVLVRTAGSAPASDVRQSIVTALDEIGVPIGAEFPKPLTDEAVRAADVVITMGCGDACPIYRGKRYEDWQLQDPAGQPTEVIRGIRDQIDTRVQQLLRELLPAGI